MISAYYISTLAAFVYTNGKRHLLPVAAITANLARVSWVYSFKRPASVFSFAFRHREKASPGHVTNCLGETAIPDHPANVQFLDRDRVKSPDQIERYLMMEILSTARYLQMRFGYFNSLLCAPLRSLPPARKPTLLFLQIVQRILEMARIFDLLASRERGETGNAYIHADGLPGRRQRLRFRYLANNQSIPSVKPMCDPKLFALPFDRAGKTDATGSNTGDCELIAFDRTSPFLLVFLREGVIAIFALESGKSRFLSIFDTPKEAFESFVKTFKRILLDGPQMGLYIGQSAGFGQMARLLVVTERYASNPVTRDTLGKGGVVDLAGMFKLTLAGLYKAFVGAELELEGLECGIFGMSHRVQCLNQCARW